MAGKDDEAQQTEMALLGMVEPRPDKGRRRQVRAEPPAEVDPVALAFRLDAHDADIAALRADVDSMRQRTEWQRIERPQHERLPRAVRSRGRSPQVTVRLPEATMAGIHEIQRRLTEQDPETPADQTEAIIVVLQAGLAALKP